MTKDEGEGEVLDVVRHGKAQVHAMASMIHRGYAHRNTVVFKIKPPVNNGLNSKELPSA